MHKATLPIGVGLGVALILLSASLISPHIATSQASSSQTASKTDRTSSPVPTLEPWEVVEGDLDSLAREVPAEVQRQPNAHGHVVIASADTADAEKTDALLKSFARGKAHLEHMRHENQFVTRRQIVELPESFRDIGKRLWNGEDIKEIVIPDFDGDVFTVDYDPSLMGPAGENNGTLIGGVKDHKYSDAILGYYEGSTSAYINLPLENRVLEYMTVGGNQIVVKEIDLEARNLAEPCGVCASHGADSPHPAGVAHHVAEGLNREGRDKE